MSAVSSLSVAPSGIDPTAVTVAGIYLALSLVVGLIPGKQSSKSAAGFVAGDRGLGLLVMYFVTGATIFSAFAFLGAPGWAYSRGAASHYVLAFGALGFVPFYFVGPRAARLGRAYGFVTPGELVAARFGRPLLAGLMALVSLVAFVPYLAIQMKGAAYVLDELAGVPPELGALVVYGVVVIYVCKSGVLGVGWTNTLQGIVMMVLAWSFGWLLPRELYGGIGPMFERLASERPEMLRAPGLDATGQPWTFSEYSSAVLVSAIGFSFWPHLFMKAFTAKSDETLRRTVCLYPTFQLFILPILILGYAGILYAVPPAAPDRILPHLVTSVGFSPIAVGLFCAGALAASMSSGDAIVHASASIAVRDGFSALRPSAALEPVVERRWIRGAVVAIAMLSYLVAFQFPGSLVKMLLFAYGPISQLVPGILAALYVRRATAAGVVTGLVLGVAVNLLFVLHPEWRPLAINAGLYGLAANIASLIAVSALTSMGDPRREQEFLAVAASCAPAARDARDRDQGRH